MPQQNGNIAEKSGLSKWITNNDSRKSNYKMRSNCDAIMVGTKTIKEDNPTLTSHGFGRDPKIVLIDIAKKLNKKKMYLVIIPSYFRMTY